MGGAVRLGGSDGPGVIRASGSPAASPFSTSLLKTSVRANGTAAFRVKSYAYSAFGGRDHLLESDVFTACEVGSEGNHEGCVVGLCITGGDVGINGRIRGNGYARSGTAQGSDNGCSRDSADVVQIGIKANARFARFQVAVVVTKGPESSTVTPTPSR